MRKIFENLLRWPRAEFKRRLKGQESDRNIEWTESRVEDKTCLKRTMNLVLHIGAEKTGSTLLQDWLYSNQSELSAQGIFLSNTLEKTSNRKLVAFFSSIEDDYWKFHGITSAKQKEVFFRDFLKDFAYELTEAAERHHTAIISSEHFHSRLIKEDDVKKFAGFCKKNFGQIKVVCYLREQSQVRKSLYSTSLKADGCSNFENFQTDIQERDLYYNYYELAKRWERAFGKQNLTFRIYERAKFKNCDLRKDFLSVLDCDIDEHRLNFNITKANESVKRIKAAALIACNKLVPLFGETGVNSLNHIFKSIILSSKSLDRFELIDIYKQNMFDTFMASNKALSKEFFDGEELFSRPQEDCETEDILSFAEVSNIVEEFTGEIISQTAARILLDNDANLLRDVAVKAEKGELITKDEAVKLMRLAARAKPKGLFI